MLITGTTGQTPIRGESLFSREDPRHVKFLLTAIGLTNNVSLEARYPKEVIHKHFPVNIHKNQVLYSKATSKKT